MSVFLLYGISFCTNAAILIFEITGGRLLAPYLGTTVEVWAGLIAVVLGGMAIGYHYGGRFGDTDASHKRISIILFLAGSAALLTWGLRDAIPTWIVAAHTSIAINALIIGTLLFVPTVILLATVSPLLAKNLIANLNTSAKVVGELNAVGTVGSIVGAIGTGVLLIPFFGISTILLSVAVLIFALAFLVSRAHDWRELVALVCIVALALYFNSLPTKASVVVADISTAYNRIFVTAERNRTTRALWTSPFGIQCEMQVNADGSIEESKLVDDYQKAYAVTAQTFVSHEQVRALFLGGCVESFPRYFLTQYPKATADVVEIDPGMLEVAEKYFGFDANAFPTLSTIYEDARTFVNTMHEPYDLAYLDVFSSAGRVPFQTVTKEMFAGIATNLTDDGVLIINTHGAYGTEEGLLEPSVLVKTAQTAFAHVGLYQFSNMPNVSQNLLIIASKEHVLPETFTDPTQPSVTLHRIKTNNNVIVLTDNYAPIDSVFLDMLRADH